MEKYSSYKDSGEKWLGEIPGHWKFEKVKHLYTMQTGFTPNTKVPEFYSDSHENVWVNISDLKTKCISDSESHISNLYIKQFKPTIVPKGSLLYSFKLSVGEVAFADTDLYTNEAIASFLPNENIDLGFLFYSAPLFIIKNANENIYGAKILNQQLIKNALIVFPPLPEQQAIVSYLDRVTGDIDRAIAESQRMIDLLNERKQIIIQHAVTKGLNPNAKRKYSGVEWIGDVPEGWDCLPLKFVFEMRNGYTPSKNDPSLWTNGSIPWYRMEDIRKSGRFLNESIQKVTQKAANGKGVFSAGSFIMAICTASIGEHAMLIVDSLANQRFANFKIRKSLSDKFLPMYLYYYFFVIGDFCRNNANSTCFQYVDMAALKNLPIAVPNMEEQRSIVSYLDENLQTLSQAIASAERKISLLRERKQIIINEVVTGKVKVS